MGRLGALVGAAVGGYVSFLEGSYIYAALGAGAGIGFGQLIGMLFLKKVTLATLTSIEYKTDSALAVLSFLMAIAGLLGYYRTGHAIGIISAMCFAGCGLFCWMKRNGSS